MPNENNNDGNKNEFSPDVVNDEEAEEITGKKVVDEEHPEDVFQMDVDKEGTGVDEPDLDSARWDDEIEPKDRDDFVVAKVDFEELLEADRTVYLEMAALREEFRAGAAGEELAGRIQNLLKQCADLKAGLASLPRTAFLDAIIKKLKEILPE